LFAQTQHWFVSVGPKTFDVLAKAQAAALVVESRKTVFLDKDICLAKAKKAGIAVLAV
jgi:DUF1009 family protein